MEKPHKQHQYWTLGPQKMNIKIMQSLPFILKDISEAIWFVFSGKGNFIYQFSFPLNNLLKPWWCDTCFGSLPSKHVFLHLKICGPRHCCSTTVLHYNAVSSNILPCSFLPFQYCALPSWDFSNNWINWVVFLDMNNNKPYFYMQSNYSMTEFSQVIV